jgi:DNA-binding transcriptional regulator YhcF (GntR family)
MTYNFTDSVRLALRSARDEAIQMQHDYVGTEHILLGLAHLEGFLERYDLDTAAVQDRVLGSVRRGRVAHDLNELPYTSRAKKVLELAMAFAREKQISYVGPDELMMGLVRETKGIAAQVLYSLGLDEARTAALADEPYDLTRRAPRRPGRAREEREARFRVRVDDRSTLSIYEQIVTQIREAVATGELRGGERLLPVRRLADELDIAPGTVARAYAELESLGVVVTSGARGTRVAETPRKAAPPGERHETLTGLLRPVAVAAFHLGGTADELRRALEAAMKGILEGGGESAGGSAGR